MLSGLASRGRGEPRARADQFHGQSRSVQAGPEALYVSADAWVVAVSEYVYSACRPRF